MLPFSSLKVVELTEGVGGPFCGELLAGAGAEVVKIEPSDGDWTRTAGPFPSGTPNIEASALFLALNAGKESCCLDWRDAIGKQDIERLVCWADVVIYDKEHYPELDSARIRQLNPAVISVSITDFGKAGPYASFLAEPITLMALGGITFLNGVPNRPPLNIPGYHADFMAGINAFTAVAAALTRGAVQRDLRGEDIDVSAFESVAANAELATTMYAFLGATRSRFYGRQPWGIQGQLMPCKDGSVVIHPGRAAFLAAMIGRPDVIDSPLFQDGYYRLEHADEFIGILLPWFAERTRAEVMAEAEAYRLPFGSVATIDELLKDEHLAASGAFHSIEHPEVGTIEYVRPPLGFHEPEALSRPPLLGEHNGRIGALGAVRATTQMNANSPPVDKVAPLAGIRIVDLSWVWAGPTCTRILADLGAEVIKIESPQRPDSIRALIPADNLDWPDYWNHGGSFAEHNLGKLGVSLNLADPRGRDLFLNLVAKSDIVVESFTPRVMEQFGLTYEALEAINPRLIMLSMSGYGHAGPKRDRAAYGHSLEAESGITSTIGYVGGPPLKSGLAYTDQLSGELAAGCVLAALCERARTGRGRWIDFAELNVGLAFVSPNILAIQLNGRLPLRVENLHPDFSPHGIYPCRGHERWVAIAITSESQWHTLCNLIEEPGWARAAEFRSASARRNKVVEDALARWTSKLDPDTAMFKLQVAGIPAGRVSDGRDLLMDPHLNARSFFQDVDNQAYGVRPFGRRLGVTFELTEMLARGPAPAFGQDTRRVFTEIVGLGAAELLDLERGGIVGGDLGGVRPRVTMPMQMLVQEGALASIDPLYREVSARRVRNPGGVL
jgi:crotonobetainyl-CoA:carnitine CoA-transferase CaiB-like acyl-CoA transferase